ncbi:MAG: alpha/beta hydrolase [Acidobacteria bacterium]|nr:alpha/beta hydrolase [Acidobacteriota bacterium]MCA1621505.1 alpha/beta hydrolase [Acidobacteriota bacterium]
MPKVMVMTTWAGHAFLLSLLFCVSAVGQDARPTKVRVGGVELHYVERGRGEPLVLLHGGQGDYRSWAPQMEEFSRSYRVIAYSRRYNYPNDNPLAESYRSAYTDADDLAAFIRHLKLGRVHLVGTSAGALAALVLATKRPEMVRSMVLAEPPVHRWAKDDPDGEALYREFMAAIWEPAAAAFKSGDDEAAMRVLVDGFGGAGRFDRLAPGARAVAMQNSRFFKAATASDDPFPDLPKEKVRRLRAPALIVTGENTLRLHKFVNDELARLLPRAGRVTIPGAGHGSARENPRAFNEAVLTFLAEHGRTVTRSPTR